MRRFSAAVVAGVAVGVCWWVFGRRCVSAAGGWQRLEFLEGCEQLADPGPCVLEVELGASAGEREAAGDVEELVAQSLRLGLREVAVE